MAEWGATLNALSALVSHADVEALIDNPGVDQQKLAAVLAEMAMAGSREAASLASLLAENKRLDLLPAIAEQFGKLQAVAEGWIDVEVTAATEVAADLQTRLAQSLSQRLGREVRLQTAVDEELIGGAVIRAGDLVIDGSVRSQLERMQQALAR